MKDCNGMFVLDMIDVEEEILGGTLVATREICIYSRFFTDDPDAGIAWFYNFDVYETSDGSRYHRAFIKIHALTTTGIDGVSLIGNCLSTIPLLN